MCSITTISYISLVFFTLPASTRPITVRDSEKPPVIIVPGFGGSRAYIRQKGRTEEPYRQIWLDFSDTAKPNTLAELFELKYADDEHWPLENEAYEITFPGWGDTATVEHLDESKHELGRYFHTLVTTLVNTSFYRRNISIRGAPYDFRRIPPRNEKFMLELRKLIEQTYHLNDMKRVALLAHSMGTLYCSYFLHLQTPSWKKTYLQAYIAISGPYGGAVRATKAFASGDDFGLSHYPPLSVRQMQRSFPSLALLLPDKRLWSTKEPIILAPKVNYSAHNMQRFFEDINYTRGYDMMRTAKEAFDYLKGPTDVDTVYCIHGTGLPTIKRVIYKLNSTESKPFPDLVPKIVYGEGDGTVNLRSLSQCAKWEGVHYIRITKAHHTDILSDKRFLELLKKILHVST